MIYGDGDRHIVQIYAFGSWNYDIDIPHAVNQEDAIKRGRALAGTYKHVLVERIVNLVTEKVWESGDDDE